MSWLKTLTDPDTKVGKLFDRTIYALIVLSLVLFALDTLPEAARYEPWFAWSERVIVAIFTIEYTLRTVSNRLAYVCGFYGIVDLLAILPFYVSIGLVDLRSIRILRLLRLLRMAKLRRYGSAWNRLRVAFVQIKDCAASPGIGETGCLSYTHWAARRRCSACGDSVEISVARKR
jgi:voltage-gated potassium channel